MTREITLISLQIFQNLSHILRDTCRVQGHLNQTDYFAQRHDCGFVAAGSICRRSHLRKTILPSTSSEIFVTQKSVSLSLSLVVVAVVVAVAVAVTCRRDSNYSNGSSSDFSVGATDLPFVYRHYKPLHAPTSQTHSNSLQASKSKPQSRIPTTTTSPSTSWFSYTGPHHSQCYHIFIIIITYSIWLCSWVHILRVRNLCT